MNYRINSQISLMLVIGFLFLMSSHPVYAQRSIEWRDGELWVIDDVQGDIFFEPLSDSEFWHSKAAVLSPDGEWVVFARHTGGGFENEGESCFTARWDGTGERMLLETDLLIHDIYWMEGPESDFIAVQLSSGGTYYRSFFSIVNFDTGVVETSIEGYIYLTTSCGTRYRGHSDSPVGLQYELYDQHVEVIARGVFYVDELIDFGPGEPILSADDDDPGDNPLTDGCLNTAWIEPVESCPAIFLKLDVDDEVDGLSIISGWSRHEGPDESEQPWEGEDLWPMYARPRIITLEFADGTSIEEVLEDRRSPQWMDFPDGVDYSTIIIRIEDFYFGTTFNQVAISEIYIN